MQKAYKYGIELETFMSRDSYEAVKRAIREQHIRVTTASDGSIRPNESNMVGVEFRSDGGMSYTDTDRNFRKFSAICKLYDVQVNSSCGYHVHVSNKRFYNPKKLDRIVKLWVAIEDVLLATQPPSRLNNQFCRRKLTDFVSTTRIYPKEKARLVSELSQIDRYYTLNLSAMARHGTIEVRLHSGTVDYTKIMNWVQLITAIYDYCLTSKYDKAVVQELLEMSISDAKIEKVFRILEVSEAVKAFYTARMELMRSKFDELKTQQEAAKTILKNRPTIERLQRAYNRAGRELNNANSATREAREVLRVIS